MGLQTSSTIEQFHPERSEGSAVVSFKHVADRTSGIDKDAELCSMSASTCCHQRTDCEGFQSSLPALAPDFTW
jgi:hypothetical protein